MIVSLLELLSLEEERQAEEARRLAEDREKERLLVVARRRAEEEASRLAEEATREAERRALQKQREEAARLAAIREAEHLRSAKEAELAAQAALFRERLRAEQEGALAAETVQKRRLARWLAFASVGTVAVGLALVIGSFRSLATAERERLALLGQLARLEGQLATPSPGIPIASTSDISKSPREEPKVAAPSPKSLGLPPVTRPREPQKVPPIPKTPPQEECPKGDPMCSNL